MSQGGGVDQPRSHPLVALLCAVVAVGLLAWLPRAAAVDPSLGPAPDLAGAAWWAAAGVLVAQAAVVHRVARHPARLLPVVAGLPLVVAATAPAAAFTTTAVAVMAAVYLAVVSVPLTRLWWALATAVLLVAVGQVTSQARETGAGTDLGLTTGMATGLAAGVAQALVVIGMPLLLGSVVAARRDAELARRQEVAALRREQEALLSAAVSQQRTAMSRDLHDIAAHHLSGIALLAAAIQRQVDADPAAAKRSAGLVREQSRAVLDDLRRLVGLLREDGQAARPVETLAALAALVRSRREAGADVVLITGADPAAAGRAQDGEADWTDRVGLMAQMVAYRMVQESLTNAAVHAPGARCVVEVGSPTHARTAVITVRNGPPAGPDPGRGSGFGLVAMAERAHLVGGDLTYGPTDDGGWQVRLSLPVEEDPARVLVPLSPAAARGRAPQELT